jgi:hypothetical protein
MGVEQYQEAVFLGSHQIGQSFLGDQRAVFNQHPFDTGSASPIPTNGLVAWYDASNASSYPGTGATWTDLSSAAGSGTIVGSPSFNSTTKLFTFDGSQRVDLTQIYSEGQQTYTYYVVASAANNGTTQLFGQATEAVNRRALIIRFGGSFGFNGYDNDNNAPAGMGVSTNTLKGIALTMNTQAADQSKAVRFFLNGTLITEGTTFNGPSNLNMGANAKIGANGGNGENFVGDIGVCIAYNRVISDAEMTQINDYYATKYTLV